LPIFEGESFLSLIILSIDRVFDEQKSDRLHQKRNRQHMSDDVKQEPRAETFIVDELL